MLLIQMAICYAYLIINQVFLGVIFLIYWGTFISSALFKTIKWKTEDDV
jgi:hypothetical protein